MKLQKKIQKSSIVSAFSYSKNIKVTALFLATFIVALFFADLSISTIDPLLEFKRFMFAIVQIDIFKTPDYLNAIFNTISIAFISIVVSAILGFIFSFYVKYNIVRASLAFIRAIHELFWALIFLQIFGLNTLTALLAIILPYSATLAKVYAEILEEHHSFPKRLEDKTVNGLILFLYTKLPNALPHLLSYTLYRFECALKSTAILGFIGLETLGYFLESSFMQGYYNEVWLQLILFYIIIATIKFWLTKKSSIFIFIASFLYIDKSSDFSMSNLVRFVTQDIVPSPIKKGLDFHATLSWFDTIFTHEVLPGLFNTIVLSQISLIFSALLALSLFALISKKLYTKKSRFFAHILIVMLRSTPEYILAFIFLQIFGPSMIPGALALALHNGSILGFIIGNESNELKLRIDSSKKRFNLYFYEILPRVYNSFLSFLFYRWEVLARESAILGILGIHTLGFFVDSAISEIKMDKVVILLFFTALLNIAIDYTSKRVRAYLRIKEKLSSQCECSITQSSS